MLGPQTLANSFSFLKCLIFQVERMDATYGSLRVVLLVCEPGGPAWETR